MRSHVIRWLAIPALVAGMALSSLGQVHATDTVDIQPVGTDRNDPNGGQWFFANLTPGQSKTPAWIRSMGR